MTWDLTLYPIQTLSWLPRWSFLIILGLLLLFLWKVILEPKKNNWGQSVVSMNDFRKTSNSQLTKQLSALQKKIWVQDTQERYREYQHILRKFVGKKMGIDIQSTSLKQIKFAHTGLPKKLMELLDQTYYFPYNLEVGDEKVMNQEIVKLKALLLHD